MPWRRIFRELSLAYGWTPQQIGEMTIAQILIYTTGAADPGEAVKCKPSELAGVQEKSKHQRHWWESLFWRGMN